MIIFILFRFRLSVLLLYRFNFLFPVRFSVSFLYMAFGADFGVYIRLSVFMRLSEIDCILQPHPQLP